MQESIDVAAVADDFRADLILLDYIQRIPPPGQHENRRGSVDATMNYLRQFADAGVAVMLGATNSRDLGRVNRKDNHGNNVEG